MEDSSFSMLTNKNIQADRTFTYGLQQKLFLKLNKKIKIKKKILNMLNIEYVYPIKFFALNLFKPNYYILLVKHQ